MHAAQLLDPELLPGFKKQLEEDAAKEGDDHLRPPLFGHSREVSALHAVEVQLALVHRSLARNVRIPIPKGPIFPAEMLAQEDEKAELVDLFGEIDNAQKKWRERHG